MSRVCRMALCLIVLLGSTWQAKAQFISASPDLPPLGGEYIGTQQAHQLYNSGQVSIEFIDINHSRFSASFQPPLDVGAMTSHSFSSTLMGDVIVNGGKPMPVDVTSQVSVNVTKNSGANGSALGTFSTQMTQLDVKSGLPGGAEIRIDPTNPSMGQTTISNAGGGLFRIDSFFDIFTDISLDHGTTWIPSTVPGHVALSPTPEPSAVSLFGLGIGSTAVLLYRRRRT